MPGKVSPTLRVLQEIREELRNQREEIRELRVELRQHKEVTDGRFIAMETRLSAEILQVVGAIHEVRDLLRDTLVLGPRVDDHERRIRALESRGGR
jgi:hypothetical protein